MRVATWNTWWRSGDAWPERERAIGAVVAEVRPDLLGLQETWRDAGGSQPEALAERLGGYGLFSPSPVPPAPMPVEHAYQEDVEIGVGLVSRWPVRATHAHHLPGHLHAPPTALAVTVDHPAGPLHVVVACTEWEPAAADDHGAQLAALAGILADPALDGDLPVLLLGDLNAPWESDLMAPLREVAVDLWTAGGGDQGAVTLPSSTPVAPLAATAQIDRRVDHVLARPGRAGGTVRVARSVLAGDREVGGVLPSDHRAVVCDVVVGR